METLWDSLSLPELSDRIWATLSEAAEPGPHPWRTPVLATAGRHGPGARIVVLRGVTRPGFELIAFSDARAAKVSELSTRPKAIWLFYDPIARVQLRAVSEVRLHTRDSVAQTYWHRLPDDQRCLYLSHNAPGTVVSQPARVIPNESGDEGQFTVLIASVKELDWLWLGPHQHRRAIFRRQKTDWVGSWVEP